MSAPVPALVRAVVVTALLALAVAACGRRGALEPPPDPSAPQSQSKAAEADDDTDSVVPSPSPAAKKRPKGYNISNQPFILDSIL